MLDLYLVLVELFYYNLPGDYIIKFTYSNLYYSNIVITPTHLYYIVVVIDWE